VSVCRITVTVNVESPPEAACGISIAYGVNPTSAHIRRGSRRPACMPPSAADPLDPRRTGNALHVVASESEGAS